MHMWWVPSCEENRLQATPLCSRWFQFQASLVCILSAMKGWKQCGGWTSTPYDIRSSCVSCVNWMRQFIGDGNLQYVTPSLCYWKNSILIGVNNIKLPHFVLSWLRKRSVIKYYCALWNFKMKAPPHETAVTAGQWNFEYTKGETFLRLYDI